MNQLQETAARLVAETTGMTFSEVASIASGEERIIHLVTKNDELCRRLARYEDLETASQ